MQLVLVQEHQSKIFFKIGLTHELRNNVDAFAKLLSTTRYVLVEAAPLRERQRRRRRLPQRTRRNQSLSNILRKYKKNSIEFFWINIFFIASNFYLSLIRLTRMSCFSKRIFIYKNYQKATSTSAFFM